MKEKQLDALHIKLASLVVHCEEFFAEGGHSFDRAAIQGLLNDAEVRAFLASIPAVLLPLKRRPDAK